MSVYKPKKSPFYHYDFWLSGLRFSGSTERASKKEARTIEALKRDEAELDVKRRKAEGGVGPMTIALAAGRYWNEVGQHHANAATTLAYLKRLVDHFGGGRALSDITDDDVAKLVAWRRAHHAGNRKKLPRLVSATTVNRSATEPLQKLFNRAVSTWNVSLPKAPRWSKHLLAEPKERVREVRVSEESAFAAVRADYLPIVNFARASGLRMAECILLKSDVDLIAGFIETIGKGGKQIRLPITIEMRAILMSEMANPTEYVFTYVAKRPGRGARKHDRGDRLPITISGLKTTWRRARSNGLPADLRFHDMRHDFATKLLRTTGNLKLVQKSLHHSKVETTVRYAHVLDDEVLAGMEAASRTRAEAKASSGVPNEIPNRAIRTA